MTGIAFVIILVAAICIHPLSFLIVFTLITGGLLWEFYGLLENFEGARLKRLINSLGGAYLFIASFLSANALTGNLIFLPYLLFLIYIMISELYNKAPNPIANWSLIFFGQIYCAGFFSLINYISSIPDTPGEIAYTPLYVLAIFIFVWLNDTGAYLIGSLFGKRRLFERISPKKSWEGFLGGLLVALATSQAFAWYAPEITRLQWLGLAFVIVVFGTWGDLIESLFKRTLNIKDSGTVFPGHGGMLDRFDSVILAIPATYVYIQLFIRN
ncbi:phosphatidate cytidylyltransferase [Parabacteroides sp. PF5-9]|nr:phosphatidate cytidylyltransferase [Parabacteroides sp. PF5-9]